MPPNLGTPKSNSTPFTTPTCLSKSINGMPGRLLMSSSRLSLTACSKWLEKQQSYFIQKVVVLAIRTSISWLLDNKELERANEQPLGKDLPPTL
ncbi:hypothetical protein BGZ50_004313 [Haplosporangium sp. Z 11]|nr:hypothetical protein BGZ50_004313 [Haplosporangium sp. Z 11]